MRLRFALSISFLALTLACGGATPGAPSDATRAALPKETDDTPRGPQKVTAVAAGDFHTCVVVAGGSVFCFGRNRDGELGDGGAAGNRPRPVAVPNLRDVEEVAAGHGFSCARVKGGTVRCWGTGKILGDDQPVEKVRPSPVAGLQGIVELKAGGFVACARTQAGAVRCWGTDAIKTGAPTAGAEEIAVAGAHACARTFEGKVTCWGEGLWGTKNAKQANGDVTKAAALSTGDSFACAVVEGVPRCWGRNDQGELGLGPDKETRTKPVAVRNAANVMKLSSAEAKTCGLTRDGKVVCWGANNEGEMGRGARSVTEMPNVVSGLTSAVEIAVGAGHVCARTKEGALQCWGNNKQGQLGDGTFEHRATPTEIAW